MALALATPLENFNANGCFCSTGAPYFWKTFRKISSFGLVDWKGFPSSLRMTKTSLRADSILSSDKFSANTDGIPHKRRKRVMAAIRIFLKHILSLRSKSHANADSKCAIIKRQ
jgi:hypothetical protein